MKIFLGVVTRIRPSGVAAILRGQCKWVILLPVKRPSRENCWTRLLYWSHTRRLLKLSINKPVGQLNCPSYFPRLPNLCKNVPDLSKALMQSSSLLETKNLFLWGEQLNGRVNFSGPTSPKVEIVSPSRDNSCILLFENSVTTMRRSSSKQTSVG